MAWAAAHTSDREPKASPRTAVASCSSAADMEWTDSLLVSLESDGDSSGQSSCDAWALEA